MVKMSRRQNSIGASDFVLPLEAGDRHDKLILFVPSHDKKNVAIPDQTIWADAACELFSKLFRGATAFRALTGVFRTDAGETLKDTPILVESYAERAKTLDALKSDTLRDFALRMGSETKQDTVALIVNDFIHFMPIRSQNDGR